MNYNLLIDNLTNPALLFFVLGIFAVYVKSDLKIPDHLSMVGGGGIKSVVSRVAC